MLSSGVMSSLPISIHSPRMRGDSAVGTHDARRADFNPLPSHEGRLAIDPIGSDILDISIHSPRMRGDDRDAVPVRLQVISIHSPRMRGDSTRNGAATSVSISIHSPRMRGDAQNRTHQHLAVNFNPLPSHEGRRPGTMVSQPRSTFQSTPLA